jgi:DnaD/phage-associated family protein
MKQFEGFPARMDFTPVPNLFLSRVLPEVADIRELKVTLYIMAAIYRQKGYPRYVTLNGMLADAGLMSGLETEEALGKALEMVVERGAVLRLETEKDGEREGLYFLNDEPGRQALAKLESGELELPGLKIGAPAPAAAVSPPDIFTLYEQNIGMLTPMLAEQLREAEKLYPAGWIRDAVKEAVNQNKRKWSYIAAILESWSAEGRKDGAYQRDSKKADPDRYIKGKYGHMVQH